jgi:hypothetical protein
MRSIVSTFFLFVALADGSIRNLELTDKEVDRVKKEQHTLDLEVAEFQKNLEGLKTTVEFPSISV